MKRISCLAVSLLLCGWTVAQAPAPPRAEKPLGEVFASDATLTGSLVLTGGGMQVMSGAAVNAGKDAAVLRLQRGGEVRICAATKIGLYGAPNGRDLLFSLSTGAVEVHYQLAASADAILTPDFRLQLPGPGDFHFAVGSDAKGNTCVKSLPRNTASLIVTELLGGGTYQVKAGEQVLFRGGTLEDPGGDAGDCGCPVPMMPVLRSGVEQDEVTTPAVNAPLPSLRAGGLQVQVEAPFVFRAGEPEPIPEAPAVARLNVATLPSGPSLWPAAPTQAPPVLASLAEPPVPAKKPKRGFFSRLGSAIASVFGRSSR